MKICKLAARDKIVVKIRKKTQISFLRERDFGDEQTLFSLETVASSNISIHSPGNSGKQAILAPRRENFLCDLKSDFFPHLRLLDYVLVGRGVGNKYFS